MIAKSILEQAKAFLCWDKFPDLSIQLIRTESPVSYFIPPSERSSILIYYENENPDFSIPLFLMFHEAGHYLQYLEYKKTNKISKFWKVIHSPTGHIKVAFEEESWKKGKILLQEFIHDYKHEPIVLDWFDNYARLCVDSYR